MLIFISIDSLPIKLQQETDDVYYYEDVEDSQETLFPYESLNPQFAPNYNSTIARAEEELGPSLIFSYEKIINGTKNKVKFTTPFPKNSSTTPKMLTTARKKISSASSTKNQLTTTTKAPSNTSQNEHSSIIIIIVIIIIVLASIFGLYSYRKDIIKFHLIGLNK